MAPFFLSILTPSWCFLLFDAWPPHFLAPYSKEEAIEAHTKVMVLQREYGQQQRQAARLAGKGIFRGKVSNQNVVESSSLKTFILCITVYYKAFILCITAVVVVLKAAGSLCRTLYHVLVLQLIRRLVSRQLFGFDIVAESHALRARDRTLTAPVANSLNPFPCSPSMLPRRKYRQCQR